LLARCAPAQAQTAQDKAAADVLFRDGKRLMQDGKYAEACPKFAESVRLDAGIGAMLWLADCYERNGQTASAWAEFREAEQVARSAKDKRESVAHGRAEKLTPLLSKMTIVVPPDADTAGLEVRRDGTEIKKPLWGTPVPVDPGQHTIAASAPSKKAWETRVQVPAEKGAAVSVKVPPLDPDDGSATGGSPTPSSDKPGGARSNDGSTQRIAGLAVAGAGVVALAIGTMFGLNAKSKLDDSNSDNHCRDGNHCDAVGVQLRSDSKDAALVSTIAFGVGIAAVGGGAALYFLAPKPAGTKPSVTVTPTVGGVSVRGTF
jgi:serine/threonine-protein kinase